ncbi:WXG100 family type VII secretion target [Stackebrandtia soli]|uniref:WXG100 family type VII secretion target n=1 Tax=Stackebrandtia soli TaxID=1892856 RepID=UPI0039EB1B0C
MNDMIAPVEDSTTATTGLWLVEDVNAFADAVESGSWVDATIGGLTVGLDVLSVVMDPLGSLASMAVGWILEHVEPLREALDEITGNADEVRSYAQTWTNVSTGLKGGAEALRTAVEADIPSWQAPAGQAYRDHINFGIAGSSGLGTFAESMASVTTAAGELVAAVREIVRDLIADCVATLLVRVPEWLAEVGLTLGIGTPWVVSKAVALIAKWVGRIMSFLDALTLSMQALTVLMG